jgi:hypothetical protein
MNNLPTTWDDGTPFPPEVQWRVNRIWQLAERINRLRNRNWWSGLLVLLSNVVGDYTSANLGLVQMNQHGSNANQLIAEMNRLRAELETMGVFLYD